MNSWRKYSVEQREYIRRYYEDTLTRDIARRLGRSEQAVTLYAIRVLNLRKSKCGRNMTNREQARQRHRTYILERRRVMGGEKQLTKMRIRVMPKRFYDRVKYLKKRGYIMGKVGYVWLYNGNTKRSMMLEERYKKQGFRFAGKHDGQGDFI